MDSESRYFTLTLESLRAIGGWAADCAERVLPVFESHAASDPRPREAIEGIREFARGGKRAARLRSLAMQAHAAAREVDDAAATAAARAAGLAAASAYTHPLVDVHQTKHIVGPAAYAALAREIEHCGDASVSEAEVRWAVEHAPSEAGEVLRRMPARSPGKTRLDALLHELDARIREVPAPGDETPFVPSDLPAGVSAPARRALVNAGFTRLEQLTQVPESQLLRLHGMGPKAIEQLREALAARGESFGAEEGL